MTLRIALALTASWLLPLAPTARAEEILVFAAASLTDALREIGADYQVRGGDKVHFNFSASSLLARQIQGGAPADLFFAADEASMDSLETRDLLVAGSRQDVLGNRLVVVVPISSKLEIKSLADLTSPAVRALALGDSRSVPAGRYAKEALERKGLWEALRARVVPTENVRAALAAVEGGNAEAGVVYKTDAAISTRVRVGFELPAAESPRIAYPVALLAASTRREAANRFLAHLLSPAALEVFRRYGFEVLAGR